MRAVLDTHVLVWALIEPRRLAETTRALLRDRNNQVVVSAASVWEVEIKRAVGRLDMPPGLVSHITEAGFETMDITARHAVEAAGLPLHHSDPFDRMLVAQARLEGLTLVTSDQAIAAYDVAVLPA